MVSVPALQTRENRKVVFCLVEHPLEQGLPIEEGRGSMDHAGFGKEHNPMFEGQQSLVIEDR
jgi:hypothetical protein